MTTSNSFTMLSHLFNNLGNLLEKTSRECVPQEKQLQFERVITRNISHLVSELGEAAKIHCNGSWQVVELEWQQLRDSINTLEKITRMRELVNPISEANFLANLRWVYERGTEDDIELLQRLEEKPPYTSKETLNLLDNVIKRIRERVTFINDTPIEIQEQGEKAYQQYKDQWEQEYTGLYIAIYQGQVVASDVDKDKLNEEIYKRQRQEGTFRAYVIKIDEQVAEEETKENSALISIH